MNGSLKNFVIGSKIQAVQLENETVGAHKYGFVINYWRTTRREHRQCHTQVTERTFAERVRQEVDSVIAAV